MSLLDQLSPKQRKAFVKTEKFIDQGFKISDATRKAGVKTSDYNNARNRIKALSGRKTLKPRNTSTMTATDLNRFEELLNKAISALTKRIRG